MEVSGQLHDPGHFTSKERAPGAHWIGGLVSSRTGQDAIEKRKISSPDLDSNADNPARSSALYDWAITAPYETLIWANYIYSKPLLSFGMGDENVVYISHFLTSLNLLDTTTVTITDKDRHYAMFSFHFTNNLRCIKMHSLAYIIAT